MIFRLIIFLLYFSTRLTETNGAKILGIYTFDMRSHYILAQTLFKELANDGHEVTVITGFKTENLPSNYKEITVNLLTLDEFKKTMTQEPSFFQVLYTFSTWREYSENNTKASILDSRVKALINTNQTFDVIVMGFAQSPVFIGLSHVFKAPVVLTSTLKLNYFMERYTGAYAFDSFISNILLPYTDEMNFYERLINTAMNSFMRLTMKYMMIGQRKIYEELFSDPKPDFYDLIASSMHIFLMNSHFSINKPLPYMTNMIETAGMQIPDKIHPLPKDLQRFMDGASNGVIYFCMGGTVKVKDMSPQKKEAILNALSKVKQKVILKWDDITSIDINPEQMYVSKWLPQNDILAHSNTKLYITHGGLLSTMEAIHHGVPIVGIPVFGDQKMNMAKYKSLNFAIEVDFITLSEESLKTAINEVLENSTYIQIAKKLSTQFRDRPMSGLQTAKYWVEYVIRHKHEYFFHSPAKNLNGLQYFNLDVYCLLFVVVCLCMYISWRVFKFLFKKLFCKKSKKVKTS